MIITGFEYICKRCGKTRSSPDFIMCPFCGCEGYTKQERILIE